MTLCVEGSHITDSVNDGYNKFKKLFSKLFISLPRLLNDRKGTGFFVVKKI